ncbi:MAG: hypothetical protein OCU18_04750 [Candidatus Syntrophoarchaeum sp.]|nr:hypothetical protein [Candidatus Syntrophoarchaeum sp.]
MSKDKSRKEWVDDGRTPHREHVLIEKIIGTFRSTNFEVFRRRKMIAADQNP